MIARQLDLNGWAMTQVQLPVQMASVVREQIFAKGEPGTRCLLDVPEVTVAARNIRVELIRRGVVAAHAVAVQAIAFDKTPEANWKVTWHQDVMFPFASAVRAPGYDLPTKKDGVDYARPPRAILEAMLAVRMHFDDCDAANGPLRVAPGSHTDGILRSSEIEAAVQRHGETPCLARAGDALLMRP
jgi:ectoine hydroxylase-related dioxygenase (phytanoyl-CoA dioxygenase family)